MSVPFDYTGPLWGCPAENNTRILSNGHNYNVLTDTFMDCYYFCRLPWVECEEWTWNKATQVCYTFPIGDNVFIYEEGWWSGSVCYTSDVTEVAEQDLSVTPDFGAQPPVGNLLNA